jgi:hypothetical protein
LNLRAALSDMLVRRADSRLDFVHLLDITVSHDDGRKERVLVPVRVRKKPNGTGDPRLPMLQSSMRFMSGPLGAGARREIHLQVRWSGNPATDEIRQKGLWEPAPKPE